MRTALILVLALAGCAKKPAWVPGLVTRAHGEYIRGEAKTEIEGETQDLGAVERYFSQELPAFQPLPKLPPDSVVRGGRIVELNQVQATHYFLTTRTRTLSVITFPAPQLKRFPRLTARMKEDAASSDQDDYEWALVRRGGRVLILIGEFPVPELESMLWQLK